MIKRYGQRPSELLGVEDGYAGYCIDEACMYILCKIDEDGRLPKSLECLVQPQSNISTIEALTNRKGVLSIDYRRNGSGIPDSGNR